MTALRAALVLAALAFWPGFLESFEIPKIALVRVLGLGALAAWAALATARGRRPSLFEWSLLAWLGVEALATAFSIAPRTSLAGEALQGEGLLTSAALAGLALAARGALGEPRARSRTLHAALAAAALACAYALFQVAGYDPMRWSRTSGYGEGFVRPFGTLGHPNLLGVVSAAACTWAVALALQRPARRWLYAPLALLALLATLLTFSRAAWLGLAAGLAVVAAGAALDRAAARPSWRALAGGAAVIALVIALFWAGGWSRLFASRASELGRAGGETGASRVEIWKSAAAMFRDRPLLGQGPDTFELAFPRWQTPEYWRIEWAALPFHAHSVYLHTLATRGLAGAAALALVALAGSLAAWRAWRARPGARGEVTLLAGGAVAIAVAGLAGAVGVNGALWLLFSASALDALGAGDTVPPAAAPARRRLALAAALAVGLATAWWSYGALAVSRDLAYAGRAQAADPAGALAAATHAAALDPNDDRAASALAEARANAGATRRDFALLRRAEADAARAVALSPLRHQHWQRLGGVRATRALLGDTAALAPMVRAYARAGELAPHSVLAAIEYARWEIVLGRPLLAIPPAREAVRLYPREALTRTTLASAMVAAGQRDSAIVQLEAALQGHWRPGEADREAASEVLARLLRERHPAAR